MVLVPHPGLTAPCAGGASVPAPAAPHQLPGQPDFRYSGTELVMLYDYKVGVVIVKNHSRSSVDPSIHGAGVQAQAPDDLSVRRGDWVYADLNNQTVDGWLWAYAPKTRKYGFIPKAYARPPAMTSL